MLRVMDCTNLTGFELELLSLLRMGLASAPGIAAGFWVFVTGLGVIDRQFGREGERKLWGLVAFAAGILVYVVILVLMSGTGLVQGLVCHSP